MALLMLQLGNGIERRDSAMDWQDCELRFPAIQRHRSQDMKMFLSNVEVKNWLKPHDYRCSINYC